MRTFAALIGWALIAIHPIGAAASDAASPYADFHDRRDPPSYRALEPGEQQEFELGLAVFNTQWVVAGTPRAERRDGLGPVFNAGSCDACHNNGARGAAPTGSGPLPVSLVIQLSDAGKPTPAYGHVLNTSVIDGIAIEGRPRVTYDIREGQYPDGEIWRLRVPRYELHDLRNGPLAEGTVIKPRLAPALFGVGLLEAVPDAALIQLSRTARLHARGTLSSHRTSGKRRIGRFGRQADAPTLAVQTEAALSREMGLRSAALPWDDCGTADRACLDAATGDIPEVSDAFMSALLVFQQLLAVPRRSAAILAAGAALFAASGCVECHVPTLPVADVEPIRTIAPYTDLLLHDLGPDLADRDATGRPVRTR